MDLSKFVSTLKTLVSLYESSRSQTDRPALASPSNSKIDRSPDTRTSITRNRDSLLEFFRKLPNLGVLSARPPRRGASPPYCISPEATSASEIVSPTRPE